MKIEKADYLFLLVGTNPLPNIISSFTRIKEGGVIYICYTSGNNGDSETEDIATRINKVIQKKQMGVKFNIKTEPLVLCKSKMDDIISKIKSELYKIPRCTNSKKVIELNYTGGTKAMSSGAYFAFREFVNEENNLEYFKIVLSYIDGEKQEIMYENINCVNEEYISEDIRNLKSLVPLEINDIAYIHGRDIKDDFEKEPLDYGLGERLFSLFINCSDDKYEKNINYLNYLYCDKRDKVFSKGKKKLKYIEENWEEINKIDNEKIKDFNVLPEVKALEDLFNTNNNKERLKYIDKLGGKWLEDYCFKILLDLKHERVIKDVINSAESKKQTELEIDLLAYRDYKLFGISTTTMENPTEARSKLFEIKERAKQIGGAEAGICYISLCRNSEDLEAETRNIFDDGINKNILIIGTDKFANIKELFKNWITR